MRKQQVAVGCWLGWLLGAGLGITQSHTAGLSSEEKVGGHGHPLDLPPTTPLMNDEAAEKPHTHGIGRACDDKHHPIQDPSNFTANKLSLFASSSNESCELDSNHFFCSTCTARIKSFEKKA